MADIVTNTLQIGNDNLILRDADAQEKISGLKEDITQMSPVILGELNYIEGEKIVTSVGESRGKLTPDNNFSTTELIPLSVFGGNGKVVNVIYGTITENTFFAIYNSDKQYLDNWVLQSSASNRILTLSYGSYTNPAYVRFSFQKGYSAKVISADGAITYWHADFVKESIDERVTALEEKIVTDEKYPLSLISSIEGIAIAGETGGIIQNYADYVVSNNIPVWGCAGKQITFNACLYTSVGFAIYDKDGEYLYGFSGGTAASHGYENRAATQTVTITLPERSCFIRITLRKEYYSTVSDFGIAVDFVNPIPTYDTFVDARLLEDVKEPHDYYFANDYLPNKCTAINNVLDLYAADGDAFMFFTDQHWFENAKQSPSLIRYIEKNCNIHRLFCGGDSYDHGSTDFVRDINDAFHGRIHHVMGNHEYFYPTTGDQLYRMYDIDHPNQIGDNGRHYYYIDNHQSRIRYIILSAYNNGTSSSTVTSGYEPEQISWLNETLSDSPYDVIVFTHDMDTRHALNLTVLNALDTYKSGGGTVIGIICGHKHWDELEFSDGGIPIISVQCDKNDPWISGGVDQEPFLEDRVTGTIREQVVDTFVIDRTNRKIHQIRTGCPIRYGTDPSEWTELESTEISY